MPDRAKAVNMVRNESRGQESTVGGAAGRAPVGTSAAVGREVRTETVADALRLRYTRTMREYR